MEIAAARVARKLYRSVKDGDPLSNGWFEDALTVALEQGFPLDRLIWEAVREIVGDAEDIRDSRASTEAAGG